MSKFVVVKFHDISTYGSNPYKCIPRPWIRNKDSNTVTVRYPSKFRIFKDFRSIIYCETPLEEWKEYTGIIVGEAGTYYEGLRFILSQDSSYIPEELLYIQLLSLDISPRKRSSRKPGLNILRYFCNLFKK
ncbi:uncharacterized protein LOC141526046 [Cotesia typhae]|uniref:uncharacterized protein LOC141526046 n=1 Tax=Cotesia typhae TaxID=2053667 RepID=UPI003D687AD5